MPLKKSITEALILVLVTLLLVLLYCAISPTGRILLKKGFRTGAGASPHMTADRSGA